MNERVKERRPSLSFKLDARITVGCIGLIVSIVLHELFHIFMHWGHITGMQFFPGSGAIFEVIALAPSDYNVAAEEAVAYTITILTLLVTTMIICKIHDAKDTRTSLQVLFPKASRIHEQETLELMRRLI